MKRNFIKVFIYCILITVMLLSMTACTQTPSEENSANIENKATVSVPKTVKPDGTPIKISWIGKTLNNSWWISVADFAKKEADSLGVELQIALPQEEVDLEKQITMVDAAIQQNADAIVISATGSDGITPSLAQAREKGIKIVNFDTRISDSSIYDAFVGADDVAGAYKAGKYICQKLGGQGDVAIITGLLTQSTGVDRREGFLKACSEYPGINVVAEVGAEWRSDLSADVTTNLLKVNPNLKAIFACNDQMAVGMTNAAKTAGKAPDDLVLVGYDGILDTVNLVMNGDLDAFVALPNLDEGAMSVRLATALILNPDYKFNKEINYDCVCVSKEILEGVTDMTIYEYATERFPLRGVTDTGY